MNTKMISLVISIGMLGLLAAAPTASATTYCTFDVYLFEASYDCQVVGVGGDGNVHWCPDPFTCVNAPVIGCYFDLTPPWYCWASG